MRTYRFTGIPALLGILLSFGCEAPERPRPPNVLIIVVDTLRADRCSLTGYDRPTTPRLAEFARDAVTYTDAWTPSGWTGPSHASLFTGLRPVHHGLMLGTRSYLDESSVTLAELLSVRGYRTACFSLNSTVSVETGLTQGFDIAEHPPEYVAPKPWPPGWAHRRAIESALAARKAGKPFFVFVNDMHTHTPYSPPEEFRNRLLPPGADPATVEEMQSFDFPLTFRASFSDEKLDVTEREVLDALYAACVSWIDEEIGELLDRFRAEDLLENTIIVVTSDHGEHLGDNGLYGHNLTLYRAARHVPILIRYPGAFAGGRRIEQTVRLEDVFPTVLELTGSEVPEGLDAESLLRDPSSRISRGALEQPAGKLLLALQSELTPRRGEALRCSIRAVYDGRFHLLVWSSGRTELYDVREDPGETRNLAAEQPLVVERLRALLDP